MTVEELKAEAKKLGYKIIPIQNRVKLLPCQCGRKRLQMWVDGGSPGGFFYVCPRCGRASLTGKTVNDARKKWNKMVKDGQGMVCKCGKCGKKKEIVCLVDNVPYCNDCFIAAMGKTSTDSTSKKRRVKK